MLTNIEFAFFDLDSTLVDLEYLHYLGFAFVIKKYFNIPYSYNDYLQYSVGFKYPDTITHFLHARHIRYTHHQLQTIRRQLNIIKPRIINKYFHLIKPLPCAVKLVKTLKPLLKGVGLVTSSSRITATTVLRVTKLERFFDFIITEPGVQHSKPHLEPYLIVIKKTGTQKTVFEDSVPGIMSAKATRLPLIAITSQKATAH